MKKDFFFVALAGFFISCTIFFSGCSYSTDDNLKHEELFTLNYGNFEDQLNFFTSENNTFGYDAHITMNDGLIYTSNSAGQKILKTSSYGDLLSVYYNPETNPTPTFLSESNEEEEISTRQAIKHLFNSCTFLSVSNSKHLYVVDTVPNERIEFDNDENIALKNIVLHFNSEGRFTNYIGQEGLEGTPFANISSIHTNADNEVIIISKTLSAVKVFWYTENGDLLYKIPIMLNMLPSPYDVSVNVDMNVDSVVPSYDKKELYIKIDYYAEMIDSESGAGIGTNYDKSSIYRLSLNTAKYTHIRDIAPFIGTETDSNGTAIEVPRIYSMIGMAMSKWCFLLVTQNKGYALMLLNLKDGKKYNFDLEIAPENTVYNTFTVTNTGQLVALLAGDEKASIYVWHTENFIK
ncbi:MAG: hypothetical protein CR988_05685 [Treponema sp.]|nr:MAG: hypothetical protein CR988_05685 [Treponema sp.]